MVENEFVDDGVIDLLVNDKVLKDERLTAAVGRGGESQEQLVAAAVEGGNKRLQVVGQRDAV